MITRIKSFASQLVSEWHAENEEFISDFRVKINLGVATVGFFVLTPFSIHHLYDGRYLFGAGILGVVLLLVMNALFIKRGRFYPFLVFLGIIPAVILFLIYCIITLEEIGILWSYPAAISFYYMLPEKRALIANALLLSVILYFAPLAVEPPVVVRVAMTQILVNICSIIFIRVITAQRRELEVQAVTDPLTGLLNRALLHSSMEQAIQQNVRSGVPMTLIALDIDHFKAINDTFGHDAGDEVLRRISDFFRIRLRSVDKVFRMGGEEFLALLYNSKIETGQAVAEELRKGIESMQVIQGHQVTISIGVATLHSDEDWNKWLKRCDDKLYQAKHGGRNQVVA